jgi:hypothetical protein
MAATFATAGRTVEARLGFDNEVSPPWVMVPVDGRKNVVLRGGNGLSLQLRTTWGTGVVTFQEQSPDPVFGRLIELTAKSPGTAFLEARNATGQMQASLEITVKARMVLRTFVHFIFEKNGRSGAAGLEVAEHMIEVANKLYLPQANIELLRSGSGPCQLPFNLDKGMPIRLEEFNAPRSWLRNTPGPLPCIASRVPDQRGCLPEEVQGPLKTPLDFDRIRKFQITSNILGHVNLTSDYNIFFVRFMDEPLVGGFTPSTLRGTSVNACIIPDSGTRGQVLAHELGHYLLRPGPSFLGPDGHSTVPGHLMLEDPGPDDIKIPKEQANYMNTSGRQYDTW